MNVIQAFKMSFKAIWSSKGRSFLTSLGIIIGIAAVVVMVSIVDGSQRSMIEMMEKWGKNKIDIYAWSWGMKDPSDKIYRFCKEELSEYTTGVTPNANFWTTLKYRDKTYQQGQYLFGSHEYSKCNDYEIELGRDLSFIDVERHNRVLVIGSATRDNLFKYIDPIGQWITLGGQRFQVIGVYKNKWGKDNPYMDDFILVPYTHISLLNPQGRLEQFVVKCKDNESTKVAKAKLETFLKPIFGDNTNVYSQDENIAQTNDMMAQSALIVFGIASISLLVGGIGVMNIMLVTVKERTREIGIRKAIGAPRRSIISQFLIEASVVSLAGGLLGILLGLVGTLVAGKLMMNITLIPTPFITAVAAGLSVLIGVLFGMFPAVTASKMQPVDALRME